MARVSQWDHTVLSVTHTRSSRTIHAFTALKTRSSTHRARRLRPTRYHQTTTLVTLYRISWQYSFHAPC